MLYIIILPQFPIVLITGFIRFTVIVAGANWAVKPKPIERKGDWRGKKKKRNGSNGICDSYRGSTCIGSDSAEYGEPERG